VTASHLRSIGLALACGWLFLANAVAQQKIRVVTKPIEPFAFTQNGKLAGFSLDLWEAVAREAGLQFEIQNVETVPQMLDALKTKQADVAIAAISITSERHASMDFSQPYYDSGLQILVATNVAGSGSLGANLSHQFLNWNTAKVLGLVLLAMFVISHLVWLFERRRNAEMYPERYGPGVWESFWWTISMLGTGGCEAKGPMGVPARLVAILWMVVSIVLIAYFTAAVTTEMTVKTLAGDIAGPGDLPGLKVGTVAASTAETWLQKNKAKVSSYPDIASAVAALFISQLDQFVLVTGAKQGVQNLVDAAALAAGLAIYSVPWRRLFESLRRNRDDRQGGFRESADVGRTSHVDRGAQLASRSLK